ncbi:MAG TPA: hypothetical protein VMG30_11795 [Acidobacteriota bacterium]|nr:hypothetical protein [Acidobacteriota bacterium]
MKTNKLFQPRRSHCWALLGFAALQGMLMLCVPALSTPADEPEVVLSRTPMEIKPYAIAVGRRMQKPGKERIVASGTITLFGENSPRAEGVRITWQFPLKIRLELGALILAFDRSNPSQAVLRTQKTADMVQTLLEDSVDGFFALQKDRISRRYLGSGFKLEGAKDSDPGMDVMQLTYLDKFRENQPVLKSYWFDSGTKLLGVVAYTSASGSATHIVIDDWRDVAGEKLPFLVERWEGNKLIMRLILGSAVFMAGANDGTFGDN